MVKNTYYFSNRVLTSSEPPALLKKNTFKKATKLQRMQYATWIVFILQLRICITRYKIYEILHVKLSEILQ